LIVRLVALFVLGTCLGSLINLGIYRLAWTKRDISPWWPVRPRSKGGAAPRGSKPAGDPAKPRQPAARIEPRHWSDRIPVVGWLGLSREAPLHGKGFWVRPMLIELLCGAGAAALYAWEVEQQALIPTRLDPPLAGIEVLLHVQYLVHGLLICLLVVASFIDLDETIIPDEVTVPGALAGMTLAALCPWSMLPVAAGRPPELSLTFLTAASPNDWPGALGGEPQLLSLLLGLGCFWGWCIALALAYYPARAWGLARRMHGRALGAIAARLLGRAAMDVWWWIALAGSAGIYGVWLWSGEAWQGLSTALLGLAFSGGLVWIVRLIGFWVLRREAMGFGDVTLMAMVGTYLGWQNGLLIFFLAPVFALLVGLFQLIFHGEKLIPFGPFLCLATLAILVRWPHVWEAFHHVFDWWQLLLIALVVCFVLMVLLLWLIQLLKRALGWGER
jgi:prepilin signal peptidase PulO-like enzyme (type II secretory pathway)